MNDDREKTGSGQASWPQWIKSLLKWIAIATAIIAAVTALLAAIGKLGDAYQGLCKTFGTCGVAPPAGPAQPVSKTVPPVIPNADSGWIDGGSSPTKFCNPRLDAIGKQFPDFEIEMTILPEDHRSEYTPFKHDIYRYQCLFSAKNKP